MEIRRASRHNTYSSIGCQRSARMRISVLRRNMRESGFYRRVLCPWTSVKEIYKRQWRTTEIIPWRMVQSEVAFPIQKNPEESTWSRKVRKVTTCRTSRFNWERSKTIVDFDFINYFCKLGIIQGWVAKVEEVSESRRSMGGPIRSTSNISLLSASKLCGIIGVEEEVE